MTENEACTIDIHIRCLMSTCVVVSSLKNILILSMFTTTAKVKILLAGRRKIHAIFQIDNYKFMWCSAIVDAVIKCASR